MATTEASNGFRTTAMVLSVFFLLVFTCCKVTASSIEPLYSVSNQSPRLAPEIRVLSLDEASSRVRRQSGINSPDTSASPGNTSPPDASNSQPPAVNSDNNSTVPPASSDSNNDTSNTNGTSDQSTVPPTTPSPGPNPFDEADVHFDHHKYYTSEATNHEVDDFWTELEGATQHTTLSNGHRVAAIIPLKFPFYFYGHHVKNVTVATGGFIYMSHFLHQWLTATQYIAPLMANFDTSISQNSKIFYQSLADKFTVEWKDVILRDQTNAGTFHFQTVLHANSNVEFLYKKVPIPVSAISTLRHPVKVGMSDAWYNDTRIPNSNMMHRTIIEYHKVAVNKTLIRTGSMILINAMQTCNRLSDCDSCTLHENVTFSCKWCNTIGRCSDGTDWYRQHWDREGCGQANTVDSSVCSSLPDVPKPIEDPFKHPVDTKCQEGKDCPTTPASVIPLPTSAFVSVTRKCSGDDCDGGGSGFPTAAVVIIVLILLGLVGALVSWVYYAYTHPTSKSGMWLMEHRPSQIKAKIKFWKSNNSSGAKYQTETEA